MDFFALLFALFMLAASAAGIWLVWTVGGVFAALGFAAFLVLVYRLFTHEAGHATPLPKDSLSAWQAPLGDPVASDTPAQSSTGRAGYRNRSYRKAMKRRMS